MLDTKYQNFKGKVEDMNELLFYDIEVFKHDAMVVFMDHEANVVARFHNDFKGLRDVIKGKILVGFNNYHYDDFIISGMLLNYTPEQLKDLNDKIIVKKIRKPIKMDQDLRTLDAFQQSSVGFSSLKKIEANMGRSIEETTVPFDIDRALNDKEIKETWRYCEYDVYITIVIFKLRKRNYFDVKTLLAEQVEIPNSYRWNTTTLSANVLLDKPLPKWSGLRVPERLFNMVPDEVREMWEAYNKSFTGKVKKKSHTIEEFDNEIVFGFGGLHGASKKYFDVENVKLLDVSSMYPSIIILLEALKHATKQYEGMKDQRIKIKHKEPVRSDAFKLVLNMVYGQMNSKYSMLHNPKGATTVCVFGQIVLYELCRRLSVVGEIININTDGVAFITDDERYKDIWHEWEQEFGLTLEEENFKRFVQKDVNNYIAIRDNGEIVAKGGEVGRYDTRKVFDNNSIRIVDKALGNYLLYDIDVIETLQDNMDNPELFQYVLQAGPTFKGTAYEDGTLLNTKVNRVFATRDDDYVSLRKKRKKDDGLVKFPNTPDKMKVYNGELSEIEDFSSWVDLNFYYKLIVDKLDTWTTLV